MSLVNGEGEAYIKEQVAQQDNLPRFEELRYEITLLREYYK